MKVLLAFIFTLLTCVCNAQTESYTLTKFLFRSINDKAVDKADGFLNVSRTDTTIVFELRDFYNDALFSMKGSKVAEGTLNDMSFMSFTTLNKKVSQIFIFINTDKLLHSIAILEENRVLLWELKFKPNEVIN